MKVCNHHMVLYKKMFERRREVFFPTLINSYNISVIRLNHYLRVIHRFSLPLNSLSRAEHFRHSTLHRLTNVVECD